MRLPAPTHPLLVHLQHLRHGLRQAQAQAVERQLGDHVLQDLAHGHAFARGQLALGRHVLLEDGPPEAGQLALGAHDDAPHVRTAAAAAAAAATQRRRSARPGGGRGAGGGLMVGGGGAAAGAGERHEGVVIVDGRRRGAATRYALAPQRHSDCAVLLIDPEPVLVRCRRETKHLHRR